MLMYCNNFFNEKIYILYMFDRKGPSISSLSNIFIYSCQYLITFEETQDWRYSHRRSMAKHDLSRGLLPTRWSRFRVNDNIQAGKIFLQEQFINHEVHRGANMRCDAVNWQDNEEERRERANKEERPPNPSTIIAVKFWWMHLRSEQEILIKMLSIFYFIQIADKKPMFEFYLPALKQKMFPHKSDIFMSCLH